MIDCVDSALSVPLSISAVWDTGLRVYLRKNTTQLLIFNSLAHEKEQNYISIYKYISI